VRAKSITKNILDALPQVVAPIRIAVNKLPDKRRQHYAEQRNICRQIKSRIPNEEEIPAAEHWHLECRQCLQTTPEKSVLMSPEINQPVDSFVRLAFLWSSRRPQPLGPRILAKGQKLARLILVWVKSTRPLRKQRAAILVRSLLQAFATMGDCGGSDILGPPLSAKLSHHLSFFLASALGSLFLSRDSLGACRSKRLPALVLFVLKDLFR
jgi:hypothetical protein